MSYIALPKAAHRASVCLALGTTVLLATACEDEVTAPEDELVEGSITLEANSPTEFVYLSLGSGQLVSVADPSTSEEWDIAFRRYSAKLNGGVAGPGGVAGFNVANNAGASEEEVIAFTPEDAEDAFVAVTEADISGATFIEDGLIPDEGGSWFRFSPMEGTLVANPGAAWRVQEAEDGSYSLFRIAVLEMAGNAPLSATVEYRHQPSGGTLGALSSVVVDYTSGPGHVDFSSGAVVAPDGCNWDVVLTPMFGIEFNAACDAGTFPVDGTEDFTGLTRADDAPEYAPFLSTISGAIPNTIDTPEGLFWYNLEENQRMWPTLNVFLVRDGEDVYKIQVTDYYNATGESGFPTVRYEQIR
jgi:hypothetical protein